MSALAKRLLGRFPAHYVADRPGKRLGHVVDSLAGDLELLATQLAGVRRAHRLGHAGTLDDLFLLGGLHGITRAEAGLLFRRVEFLEAAAAGLLEAAGGTDEDRAGAAAAVLEFWGVESPETGVSLFAPDTVEGEEPDLERAAARLAAAARRTLSFDTLVERVRSRVRTTAVIHREGNGTVAAVLEGVANALDLELDRARNRAEKAELAARDPDAVDLRIRDDLFHSRDHFLHASFVRDRGPLVREVPTALPANLVRIAGPTSVFVLAGLMDADPAAVLATARDRDPAVADVDTLLDFDAAEAVAGAHDFVLEWAFRSRIRLRGPTTVAALARSAAVPVEDLLERLDTLDVDADATTVLGPATAARAVRYWGVRVDEELHDPADVVGLEENPLRRFTHEDQDAPHGHRFTILRKGFGRTLMRVGVDGLADPDGEHERTVGPMLVNRDEGRGIGYFGTVPAGQTLEFQEEGRVFLDGSDVTDHAYSWKGACFADATARHEKDFVFQDLTTGGDRWARFAEATPPGALDREAGFPHDGAAVEMPGVAVGATRMAFFVQVNRLSSREGTAEERVVRTPTPHPFIGFADRSLFALPATEGGPLPPPGYPVAARVLVSWLEHEAYAARVFIPARFQALESETPVADRLHTALERFRPAGVELRVEYIDDRWTLGEGTLTAEDGGDPLSLIRGGTELWPTPADDD